MLSYLASNKVEFLGTTSAKLQIPAHYVPRYCGKDMEPMGWKLDKVLLEPRNPGIKESGTKEAVNLGRHNEVAFRQAVDFMGPEGGLDFAPGKQNVRMMSLLFGQSTHAVYEI